MELDESSIHERTGLTTANLSEMLSPGKPKQPSLFKTPSTRVNLQKSIQLLDDAAGLPVSSESPPFQQRSFRSQRNSHLTPKSGFKFPSSMIKRSTPYTNQSFNETLFQSPVSAIGSKLESAFDDVTTTNVGLLLDEEPELAACTGLYNDFMEAYRTYFSPQKVFELLDQYNTICDEQLKLLKKLVMRTAPNQQKLSKKLDVYNVLYSERDTWQLVISLFKDRLEDTYITQMEEEEDDMNSSSAMKYVSDKNLMSALFKRDSAVREAQIVVDWLENCAKENLSILMKNNKIYSGQAVAWENTLHRLQKKSRFTSETMERPLVKEMDPDAPMRHGRVLDDLDQEDELLLLQQMFACIRAGDFTQAQEICINYGQSWRAATLEGWILYHDSNFESTNIHDTVKPVEGNLYRDVWKRTCWAMCKQDKYNIYEKAIYATLSGNLNALLPVCRSWGDYVWAYFRTYVDQMVEQEIHFLSHRKKEALPSNYLDKRLDPDLIFKDIQACDNEPIRKESSLYFNMIQKLIILNDTDCLINKMYEWLTTDKALPSHFVRFMAHLVLFFQAVGLDSKPDHCNAILKGYVDHLMRNGQKRLIATYVATLPTYCQALAYAEFLEEIEQKDERHLYLNLAKDACLDVPAITKTVVENIRKKNNEDLQSQSKFTVNMPICKEDLQKIEAIDWLVFDQSQRSEAIRQANAVMRGFLATNKTTAARQVFEKLPPDSVDIVYQNRYREIGSKELSHDDSNAVREHLCIKACLDAIESFNDWFEMYYRGKPTPPEALEGANFTERMAYDHKMKLYETEFDHWKHGLELQTKTTKNRIYNILLFADGGWMVDQFENETPDDSREQQMKLLRQLCIPKFIIQLHQILHSTENYVECMQLAEILTSEKNALYQVFTKTDLQEILKLLRQSSMMLVNNKQDPFGYEDPMIYELETPAT